jgi:structure-specific recognition protein 1
MVLGVVRVANVHREAFNEIYLNLSRKPGATRFSDSGFGWKPANGETYTCDQSQIISAQWSRAARGYEVKILSRNDGVIQLDGFKQDDFDRVAKVFKTWYSISLDNREHALRGWNWGKADFGKAELTFNVANRPAFEVPYTEVSNTNLAGKNEVAVDFSLPADGDAGANGHLGGAKFRGKKSAGARDQLVEMRFYIPGVTTKKEKNEDGEDVSGAEDGDGEEQNAANLFYETLMDKAEIGEVAGDTFATFLDILHLTPRYVVPRLCLASANSFAEVASISTCTRALSACEARRTTTRYNSTRSRSSWCFQSQTICTH